MVIELKRAISLLREGQVIAIPTETVWGLAARADDPVAVGKLRDFKGRKEKKPLTLFPESVGRIGEYAKLREAAKNILDGGLIPGPLTVILEARINLKGVVAHDGSIGIRIPKHREALRLLAEAGFPLATTSANPPGLEPARRLRELEAYFPGLPALRGESGGQEPSTLIDLRAEPVILIRRGPVGLREIEAKGGVRVVSDDLRVLFVCTGGVDRSPAAARWVMDQGIDGLEARHVGTLWAESEILLAATWADMIFPMEEYHKEFLEGIGVSPFKIIKPLGVPDPHGLEESVRQIILADMKKTLYETVLPEIRARLRL
ncbi:MAG: L-threonylcarbamoyladenylate synthase [candidate division WOR-3 bacterium]